MQIRNATLEDLDIVFELYQAVAKKPGGLARLESEISVDYIKAFLEKSIDDGIVVLALEADANGEGELLRAEMHAYVPALYCFSHVLSDLTIAVHPDAQGSGLGRRLFEYFMQQVVNARPDIQRIELVARESNQKAIAFYQSLGFEQEGIMQNRIRNVDSSLENDIPMAWQRVQAH